ncbi:hypothetical protein BDK51DRAFT_42920 [Blyttiomyces helicus]|uniref:Uncharacterized protein n=1 Tax=Blyttiomyces helicus TaxID=388810 RepID=A0A4P9WPD9_9FUNG|nr:hypothetical protein BDK51DRAFT_42920 [Blyttiomyces helicus]|eukprot:RKO94362.1 hypothetical protein BDK51DRAFT_42920 [Blyttiomyces helicus]
MDFVNANPDKPWHWGWLSSNSKITMEMISANPDEPWDHEWLSGKRDLTINFMNENPEKPWTYELLSGDPNITIDFINENPNKPCDYKQLSSNPSITMDIVSANPDKTWNYTPLSPVIKLRAMKHLKRYEAERRREDIGHTRRNSRPETGHATKDPRLLSALSSSDHKDLNLDDDDQEWNDLSEELEKVEESPKKKSHSKQNSVEESPKKSHNRQKSVEESTKTRKLVAVEMSNNKEEEKEEEDGNGLQEPAMKKKLVEVSADEAPPESCAEATRGRSSDSPPSTRSPEAPRKPEEIPGHGTPKQPSLQRPEHTGCLLHGRQCGPLKGRQELLPYAKVASMSRPGT